MSVSGELDTIGGWEWRTEHERLLMPSSHAGEHALRVRYRRVGDRVFRSFLLMSEWGEDPPAEAIVRAIEAHAAK